jgi:hypothetical protein
MTTPAPVPLGWPENSVIWCTSCGEYYATASQPLCPICLDDVRREAKQ